MRNTTKNHELFEIAAAHILSTLFDAFPRGQFLDEHEICEELKASLGVSDDGELLQLLDHRDGAEIVSGTIEWLEDEMFIRSKSGAYALTQQGWAALRRTSPLDGVGPKRTLGDRLKSAAQEATGEAGRSAVSATIGEVIGAMVKGFTS